MDQIQCRLAFLLPSTIFIWHRLRQTTTSRATYPAMLPSLLQAGALLGAFLSAANAGVVQTPFKIPSFPSEQDAASSPQILTHPSLPAHSLRVTQPPGSLCERAKGTRSWSGYLDVDVAQLRRGEQNTADDGREDVVDHLYFWAFGRSTFNALMVVSFFFFRSPILFASAESRSNPKTDPVLLWLNGGPGCSSFTGLLQELGPCNILDPERKDSNGEGTEWNEWSWNSNATVVFLDQVREVLRRDAILVHGRVFSYSGAATLGGPSAWRRGIG